MSKINLIDKQKLITLQVGIISMLVQIWCGSFAVFYYSAQIFSDLSDNDITQKTIYTICLGLSGFIAQFSTIYMVNKIGSKYILMIGSLIIGSLNLAVSIISEHANQGTEFVIFILLLLLIMTFASTLGPVAWYCALDK
ncbi:unnamed protein product [Paramecium sonneborni]|uniref:Major facilitator superfamily (MFS) profile domain-containing protein n=1 Tax=Paramecium sonneborni TaxID=65129 RepID=A0A8S1QE05_9CILI|nr:unnamed protein product [Paramecium sonneborni]